MNNYLVKVSETKLCQTFQPSLYKKQQKMVGSVFLTTEN